VSRTAMLGTTVPVWVSVTEDEVLLERMMRPVTAICVPDRECTLSGL
jgi:hypothetical protein